MAGMDKLFVLLDPGVLAIVAIVTMAVVIVL